MIQFSPEQIEANLTKPPLEVRHQDLDRLDGSSEYKSKCPVCPDGLLPMLRDQKSFRLLREDGCIVCGRRFIYLDVIEAVELKYGPIIDLLSSHHAAVCAPGNPVPFLLNLTQRGLRGLDTGAEAPLTTYYVWGLVRESDGRPDYLMSASDTSPTVPDGYRAISIIGTVRNNAQADFEP